MKLSFLTPNSALRIILKLLIPHCALLIIFSSCINVKFNHPMDGAGGLLSNYVIGLLSSTAGTTRPSITVKIGDVEYKNGDTITINATKARTDFTQRLQIYNNTAVNLNLTASGTTKIQISGIDSSSFTALQPNLNVLIPGSSVEFGVTFNVSSYPLDKTATILIPNDDITNSNFSLKINGKCAEEGSGVFVSILGTMEEERNGHITATLLSNGKVLVTGGLDSKNAYLSSAELYDSSTNLFTATGSMGIARAHHSATLLSNGKVLIAGGKSGNDHSSAEIYDPDTGLFTFTGNMGNARADHTATMLFNGKVLIAGGNRNNGGNGAPLSSAELFDPMTGLFTATGNMATEKNAHSATLLANGRVLIVGGWFSSRSAELYDSTTGIFTATAGSTGTARSNHTATLLSNGNVLIVGGSDVYTEIYDSVKGLFTSTGNMAVTRTYHTATLLSNGYILIAGGTSGNYNSLVEIYDPATGLFTFTGSMISLRQEHSSALLPNGKVLILGGRNSSGGVLRAEVYSP